MAASAFKLEPIIMITPAITLVIYRKKKMEGLKKCFGIIIGGHFAIAIPFLYTNSLAYFSQIVKL